MTLSFAPGDLVRARGREWVALPAPRPELLVLRPLSGGELDSVVLDPRLEFLPVGPARFDLPANAMSTVQSKAALLADALRLTLRRGAGPFRSAAQLAFEPRSYQLVPLLMALRLAVPRLLIADDVGIGKTIEAGLILRELMDRGEADAFSVLCPPHLVDQWTGELKSRFGIDAVAVTSGTAARLERALPPRAGSLFDEHPHTVVSLDYIKAETRRNNFAHACPDFVIVDEAHACVGTHRGKQQRFDLLSGLANDPERRMILLTATPHSGDEEAFARLLSLIDPAFAPPDFDDPRYRERLARHFVQRRRIDLTSGEWGEVRAFPRHETKEAPYHLSPAHRAFHEAVLDYCLGVVSRSGDGQRDRRLAFWGTLALMRCVGSSPAAALSALRNRASTESDRLEPQIYDEDGEEDAVDLEPGAAREADPALADLIRHAERLAGEPDPKLGALIDLLKPLIKRGANPVVFCRYLATAENVRDGLRQAFPRLRIEAVTGVLTPDERRDRVADMAPNDEAPNIQRLLVATDCLSEGINLQQLFDTVVHYDLSWNPTRHQQREGRVDRFGQPAKVVRSTMMFSPDSAIDGAVLEVILRKAEDIREATGVTVPLPDERGPVTDALMAAVLMRRGDGGRQLAFDLRLDDGTRVLDTRWRDVAENEKRSRARFAQNAIKPQEVAPEWRKATTLLGSPKVARIFVERVMARFGVALEERRSALLAHVGELAPELAERLEQRGMKGSVRLAMDEPAPSGTSLITRSHPLTATLAEALVEASLDPDSLKGLGIGRVGAWPTPAVEHMTRLALLRIRFKLTVHGRRERLLLAEEAALVALRDGTIVAADEDARALLDTPAAGDLAVIARDRLVNRARDELPAMLDGPLAAFVQARAEELAADHARLRAAAGSAARVSVEGVFPPDVIGLFVLMPSEV